MISNLSYSPETPNLGQIRRFLEPRDLEIWRMTFKNNRAPFICYFKLLCSILWPLVNSNWSYSPETPNLGHIRRFLELCDLEIWQMTFKNKRAPLLNIIKLYASFHHHTWILLRRQFPSLRGPTWRNNGRSAWNGSRFEHICAFYAEITNIHRVKLKMSCYNRD